MKLQKKLIGTKDLWMEAQKSNGIYIVVGYQCGNGYRFIDPIDLTRTRNIDSNFTFINKTYRIVHCSCCQVVVQTELSCLSGLIIHLYTQNQYKNQIGK